ncbi:glutaredoxin-like protein NrdH [Streptomyces sp. TRM76323]|uniref:Glutaredoxin-like protein NrdH n=1 Tax=Streptomyces tamarix TaxID=3078565 RepID=A0ABU3QKV2_9ACTN|nr:glutaredoxin-like protein NrdH [Streptomyces tamarix]MDT9683397.1 glutaredoxin-like protein NrdH [Streptomyces tamarix]
MIVLYSKRNCIQCKATKKMLDKIGVEYSEVNTDDNPDYLNSIKSNGFKQLPVIEKNGEMLFSGFRPSEINKL